MQDLKSAASTLSCLLKGNGKEKRKLLRGINSLVKAIATKANLPRNAADTVLSNYP